MKQATKRYYLVLPALALAFASMNCAVDMGSPTASIDQTQTALAVQQTSLAVQKDGINATLAAQQATQQAEAAVPAPTRPVQVSQPTPDFASTQMSLVIQQTALAEPAGMTPIPVSVETTPLAPAQPPVDFEAQMKTASILVYEDIVVDPSESQYVKKTLESMGLQYKWDGNAVGWLKNDLLSGPGGKPWDLVILAIEARGDVSGEYFDYLNDALNAGSSVILEAWHLDEVSEGAISPILAKCGVMVYPYFTEGFDIGDALIWPISGASHPLLQQPNGGMSFTKARDKWFWSFDLGSKMALTGQGDAQLLLGTKAQDSSQDGVLASCMGGQLTLQTFSSHTFTFTTMYPLWENYIYNALKFRFEGAQ